MWSSLLEFCGAVSIVGAAVAVVWKAIAPQIKRGQDIKRNAEAIAKLQRHEANDFEALREIRQIEREQCRVMLVMLNHMIDGNSVESMKSTRKELERLIIDIDE